MTKIDIILISFTLNDYCVGAGYCHFFYPHLRMLLILEREGSVERGREVEREGERERETSTGFPYVS